MTLTLCHPPPKDLKFRDPGGRFSIASYFATLFVKILKKSSDVRKILAIRKLEKNTQPTIKKISYPEKTAFLTRFEP